jgi:hypothetical protein
VTQCAGGWHGVPGGARGGAGHDAALWGAGGALTSFTESTDSTHKSDACQSTYGEISTHQGICPSVTMHKLINIHYCKLQMTLIFHLAYLSL